MQMLEPQAATDPTIAGFAVSALIDLGAVEGSCSSPVRMKGDRRIFLGA
jgi:hypothetical protein